MKKFAFPLALVVVVAGLVTLFVVGNKNGGSSSPQTKTSGKNWADNLPGLLKTPVPWPANQKDLKARLDAIGLEALGTEGQALHIHQHLDLYIEGKKADVPPNIGVAADQSFISHLHTHDNSGIMHVESPTIEDFTLGQFFAIWGVDLNANCIGTYCSSGDKKLKVFVNGKPLSSDPRGLKLDEHQEIVITYGTDAQLPSPIPSKFNFPANT